MPREEPTAKPNMILGRRISRRIVLSGVSMHCKIIGTMLFKGIQEEPMQKETRLIVKTIAPPTHPMRKNFLINCV